MYRPKEEVAVKGYIREITGGKFGDVEPIGDVGRHRFTYSVKDSQSNEIAKGTTTLNAFGAFDFKFKLPDNVNLGYANRYKFRSRQSTRIIFRFRNFADRNLKLRRKSKPKRRIWSANRRMFRSKRNIMRAAVWLTPMPIGR